MAKSLISVTETDTGATQKGTALTVTLTVAIGDIIIVSGMSEDSGTALTTVTDTNSRITWNNYKRLNAASNCYGLMEYGVATSAGTTVVTIGGTAPVNQYYSACVWQWRGAQLAATPAFVAAQNVTGAPTATVTTTAANSVICAAMGDWSAVSPTSRAYRNPSLVTEIGVHDRSSTGNYVATYWQQTTTTAGAQTIGETLPTGQKDTILAIEVQDASSGTAATATGAVTLAGAITAIASASGIAGSVVLGGSVTPSATAVTATGSLSLGGSAATVAPPATGSISLGGSVTAKGVSNANGSIALAGAAATVVASAIGSVALSATLTAKASSSAIGSIVLSGASHVIMVYYVSAVGSDGNDGESTGSPWQTLSKVNATLLNPADTVLFRGGDTFTGLLDITHGGAALNPITIGSYGAGRASIANTTNNAVFGDSVGGYSFHDLNFNGTGAATGHAGVNYFANGTGQLPAISFTNCSSSGWQYGIQIGGQNAGDGYNGITIDGCDLSSNLYGGLSTFSLATFNYLSPTYAHQNLLLRNTSANSNNGSPTVTGQGTGSGINVASINGGVVTGCSAHDNGIHNGDTSSGPVGIWVSQSNGVTVTTCLAYNNGSGTSVDGDGFDLDQDCTNCTIEYCLAYGNGGAGILLYGGFSDNGWSNNICRFNLMWGNGTTNSSYGDLTLGGLISGAQVYNNTCISKDGASTFPSPLLLQYSPGMTGCAIRNNIFYESGFGDIVYDGTGGTTTQVEMQGNLYFSPHTTTIHWGSDYTTLAAWRTASSQELVSGSNTGLMLDPKFISPTTAPTVTTPGALSGIASLRLKAGSPAIGAGLDLLSLFAINIGLQDLFGDPLSSPPSIGADALVPISASGSISLGGSVSSGVPATATGALSLSASTAAGGTSNVIGSLTLTGVVAAVAPTTASGSIILVGTANWTVALATGSIALAGSVTAAGIAPATAAGSLSLSALASASAPIVATGAVTLAGAVAAAAAGTGISGSVSLASTASAAGIAVATAAGSLSLLANANAAAPVAATGSVTLSGSGSASPAGGATGSISLSATVTASGTAPITASGSITLGATAATVVLGITGSITLSSFVTAQVAATGSGAIALSGSVTAAASVSVVLGTLTLAASASAVGGGANTASGSITLAGAASAVATDSAIGSLSLSGNLLGSAPSSAGGSILLGGSVTGASSSTSAGSIVLGGSVSASSPTSIVGLLALLGAVNAAGKAPAIATGSLSLNGTAAARSLATAGATGFLVLGAIASAHNSAGAFGSIELMTLALAVGVVPPGLIDIILMPEDSPKSLTIQGGSGDTLTISSNPDILTTTLNILADGSTRGI